ncbi:transcriptional repressor brinker [Cochliomyia hominivorax]
MESDHQNFKNCYDIQNSKNSVSNQNNENKEGTSIESINNRINVNNSQVSLPTNKGINNSNSAKMGSRRIFTPQFKLQVLESYRKDSDCKGNQRATARKYNIHRRQIQKWLQCESTLRSSVANINQNSIKHQFHNINLQQSKGSTSGTSLLSNQLHSTHLNMESTRGAVLSNIIKVPSLSTNVTSTAAPGTNDILETSVVAASGTIDISTSINNTPVTAASPLRSSTVINANINSNSLVSPLIHHFGISPYNNIYTQQHVHQTHPPHHTSYQYHNITYSPTISHHRIEKHQSTPYFTPISLSNINGIATASTSNCYPGSNTDITDLITTGTKMYSITEKNRLICSDNMFHPNYEFSESTGAMNFNNNHFKGNSMYNSTYPFVPMDLSLPHRREAKPELVANVKPCFQNTDTEQSDIPLRKEWNDKRDVVDLTFRKRRVDNTSNSCNFTNEFSEKYLKLPKPDEIQDESNNCNTIEIIDKHVENNTSYCNEDDEIEIEVGMEEKFAPSKPVKLFKPYLLDELENNNHCVNKINKQNEQKVKKPISCFSNRIDTTINDDIFVRENKFPDIKDNQNNCVDSNNFHVESRSESPRSACSSATSVPTISPTNFQYPKGSPASSGYESSTSTYSDSSLSPRNEKTNTYGQTYSVKVQLQSFYNENVNVLNSSQHVQSWLEKDNPKSTHNSSIALLV